MKDKTPDLPSKIKLDNFEANYGNESKEYKREQFKDLMRFKYTSLLVKAIITITVALLSLQYSPWAAGITTVAGLIEWKIKTKPP